VWVDCTNKDIRKAFNRDYLIPASNGEFEGIAEVEKELGMMR
jgi:hypothetical protein